VLGVSEWKRKLFKVKQFLKFPGETGLAGQSVMARDLSTSGHTCHHASELWVGICREGLVGPARWRVCPDWAAEEINLRFTDLSPSVLEGKDTDVSSCGAKARHL